MIREERRLSFNKEIVVLTCKHVRIAVLGFVVFLKRGIRRKGLSWFNRLKEEKQTFC